MQMRLTQPGALASLAEVVSRCRDRAGGDTLVVGGMASFEASGAAQAVSDLPGRTIVLRSEGDLPRLDEVSRLRGICGPGRLGCVVAIGGGRVIDVAKLVASVPQSAGSLEEAVASGAPVIRKIPLVAVPTTAGSGSESTPFAVCYVDGRKTSVDHPSLLPSAAIVDARTLQSLSSRVIATAGLDAICQSIEALLSRRANPASNRYAERALRLACDAVARAVSGEARAQTRMARAASEAGRAIAITRTTAPHALSYALSQRHGVAHGHAVALSMGRYLEFFGAAMGRERTLDRYGTSFSLVLSALNCSRPDAVHARWRGLVAGLGLPSTAEECGLSPAEIAEVARSPDPQRFANSPVPMRAEQISRLLA